MISTFSWEVEFLTIQKKQWADVLYASTDRRSLYLKEDDYFFRTVFGDIEYNEGIHYWEIVADSRTEHELKIGVSKSKECD